MFRTISFSALILACAAASGCGDDSTPTTPVDPPVQITETFSGTLNVNSAALHTFVTQKAGQASATISSLSPDTAASVSFIFGTWNGNNCQLILVKDDATTSSSLVGNASALGSFCVRLSDIGRLTAPTDYSISVTHY